MEAHIADTAEGQRQEYNKHSQERSFKVNDSVWLSIPTARKLDPRWEGNWVVTACKSPVNVEISNGPRKRVVHINRIRHRIQPDMQRPVEDALPEENQGGPLHWQAPQVDHQILDLMPTEEHQTPVLVPVEDQVAEDPVEVPRRYPQRVRHRPDYL